jgi:hypothetical protein
MHSSHSDSLPHSAKNARNRKFIFAGVLAVSGIILVSLVLFLKLHGSKAESAERAKDSPAELISSTGMVFVARSGKGDWQQATVGAQLMEGDLVRTDSSGEASIRYSNGSTVSIQASTIFTVRIAGDGSMEISVPSQETELPSDGSGGEEAAVAQNNAESGGKIEAIALGEARARGARPFIKLDRIIPFGRSLELIGSVEAGSRLTVNSEAVEVEGDGSFKHFTNPFPVSAQRVRLVMKVSDLAGRVRIVTATHDFSSQGGDN